MDKIKNISRKRFLLWGAIIVAGTGILNVINPFKKKKPETFKFLTQDGQLVEVDKKYLESKGVKINNDQLKAWIKK